MTKKYGKYKCKIKIQGQNNNLVRIKFKGSFLNPLFNTYINASNPSDLGMKDIHLERWGTNKREFYIKKFDNNMSNEEFVHNIYLIIEDTIKRIEDEKNSKNSLKELLNNKNIQNSAKLRNLVKGS